MKIPLWCLLVLLPCLFNPGRSDCQRECVACGLLLQEQQQLHEAFNTMVCLLGCEGHVSPSLTWELCQSALKISMYPPFAEEGTAGELDVTSLDVNSDSELQSAVAQPFHEGDQDERNLVRYDSSLLESSEEEEEEAEGPVGKQTEDVDESSEAVSLSKRFGGFQRGRHGYRKLIGSPARHLQKRYGGFIGVRKSARKWNSQKRVNQLLRQYLGMRSSRSGRFNLAPVTRVWRQNKL
uniref:prepronociceptin b n=1 Tax=Doryrhamphus excisus TaxID=161450 RepID=UPI0025AE0CC8|nr:prepronociceptin b [Doryrhamphus excisus]